MREIASPYGKAARWLTGLLLVVGALAVSPAMAQAQGPTLRVGVAEGPSTLDPHLEPASYGTMQQVYENLVSRGADGALEPSLATSWTYLPEEAAWLFDLRQGVIFHNGDLFTAEDVKFSFDRITELGARSPEYGKVMQFVQEVQVLDDHRLKIIMNGPDPLWINNLTQVQTVLPKDHFQRVGAEAFAREPVGTGPYRVTRFLIDQEVALEAFEGHWAGIPEIQTVVFRVIPDESTRVAELLSGGLDLILGVPAEREAEIAGRPNLTVFSLPSTVNLYLGFNTAAAPFDDPRVRQAIAMATPVELIQRALFGQFAVPARTAVQRTSFGHDATIEPHPFDPDAARRLLTEAGYPDGFDAVMEVAPLAQWPRNVQVAEAIAGALADVGIRVSVNRSEFADFVTRYRAGQMQGMYIWGNTAATFDAFRHLNLNFRSGEGRQGLYWNEPEVDRWIEEAGQTADETTRLDLYAQIQRRIHEVAAIVPLVEYTNAYGMSTAFDWAGRGDAYVYPTEVTPALRAP